MVVIMPEVSERSGSFSILKSLKSSLDFVRHRFDHTYLCDTLYINKLIML
jgi:hypothetical protein